MDQLDAFARELSLAEYLLVADSCRARVKLLRGEIAAAQWARLISPSPTPDQLFTWLEVPSITRARILLAFGSEGSLRDTADQLRTLRHLSEACRFTGQTIEIAVLQTLALEKQGRCAEAMESLEEAVAMAAPGGWVRPFVEAGKPMAGLLERLTERIGRTDHLRAIIDGMRVSMNQPATVAARSGPAAREKIWLQESLTNRELDILELVAQRLQNKEIAARLFVSVDTVKTHLKIYDRNGLLVHVNSAFERLWLIPREDVVVGRFNVFESAQVKELGLLPYLERAYAGERVEIPDMEFDASREEVAKGRSRKRWISTLVYPIRDAAGQVKQMAMIHEDITERVSAEQAKSRSEDRLRLALEATNTVLYEWYPKTEEAYMSPTWFTLLGYESDVFPHAYQSWAALLHPEDRPQAEQTLSDFLQERSQRFGMEYRLRGKDGAYRWIHAQGAAVEWNEDGDITRVVGIHSDITGRRESDEKLSAYQHRLRALAAELTATEERERRRIATELHDGVAQSLAFARMQLAAVSRTVHEPTATAQLDELSMLLKESLQQVREALLDLTSPALNELGLAAALSEWLAQQVGERHGLQTAFEDDAGNVPLNEDARALLFRNARELLMNVLKHAQSRKVTVAMTCRGDALRIRVQDDGDGFDPLTLTQRPGKPGAFGLFSIRERIADVGGSLKIVSKPGAGTTATLIAPLDRLS